jgi:hypothetical protein
MLISVNREFRRVKLQVSVYLAAVINLTCYLLLYTVAHESWYPARIVIHSSPFSFTFFLLFHIIVNMLTGCYHRLSTGCVKFVGYKLQDSYRHHACNCWFANNMLCIICRHVCLHAKFHMLGSMVHLLSPAKWKATLRHNCGQCFDIIVLG